MRVLVRNSRNKRSSLLSGCRGGKAGFCGRVCLLRSGGASSISVGRAGYGGAPTTPGVMAPIVVRGRERKREKEKEGERVSKKKRSLGYGENLD
jgi:hypothetical protein